MEFSIKFSYVDPIQGSFTWPTLRSCDCNIKQVLAILTIFPKYLSSLTIALRYYHEILLGLETDILLHLSIVLVNSLFEKRGHIDMSLVNILSNKDTLTDWFCTKLNIWCNTC